MSQVLNERIESILKVKNFTRYGQNKPQDSPKPESTQTQAPEQLITSAPVNQKVMKSRYLVVIYCVQIIQGICVTCITYLHTSERNTKYYDHIGTYIKSFYLPLIIEPNPKINFLTLNVTIIPRYYLLYDSKKCLVVILPLFFRGVLS